MSKDSTQNIPQEATKLKKLAKVTARYMEMEEAEIRTNGRCCFNHIIGLPQKDGIDKPLYGYEGIIFDSLVTQNGNDNYSSGNKHLWIKKATGLGVSEFMLRFMAWLCIKDDKLSDSQMCIVTGPRIDLAIALIDRMKKLFADKGLISFVVEVLSF
jgi:hypothetical protein